MFLAIESDSSMASSDLDDAELMVGATQHLINGPITEEINNVENLQTAVQQEKEKLEPVATALTDGLTRYAPQLNVVSSCFYYFTVNCGKLFHIIFALHVRHKVSKQSSFFSR